MVVITSTGSINPFSILIVSHPMRHATKYTLTQFLVASLHEVQNVFDEAQLNKTGKIISIAAHDFIYIEKFFGSSHSTPNQ